MSELPIVSVTELVSAFKEVVEAALPPCTVEGELSNCRKSPAGHWYVTPAAVTVPAEALIGRLSTDYLVLTIGLNALGGSTAPVRSIAAELMDQRLMVADARPLEQVGM